MELIDQIRFNLPDEIKQANWTVVRAAANHHRGARRGRAHHVASQRARGGDGRPSTRSCAAPSDIRRRWCKDAQAQVGPDHPRGRGYALEQLKQLEAHLGRTLATVRRGVEALQSEQPPPPRRARTRRPVLSVSGRIRGPWLYRRSSYPSRRRAAAARTSRWRSSRSSRVRTASTRSVRTRSARTAATTPAARSSRPRREAHLLPAGGG